MANETSNKAADAANEATRNAADAATGAATQATDQMRAGAEKLQAAGGAMADTGSQLGMKMLDQAETNTAEAFKAMRAAAAANDVSEIMRIQSEYIREQGSRSVGQVREISELIANFGRTAMGQMTGRS
ncbi:phasin family protein [Sphingomonas sp. S1-29]|uniref:phasin family protein n=1 Tax=Sphingomonas sp. S1-29 TaxID=2991074 RepID=UPI00223FA99E|nr:phasin family protein [Sphingomonas sp. S1-29]UZK69336.1 phasin family protein [Sphingomonas sp. S1-29]